MWALQCLSEIYAALGDAGAAATYAAVHTRAVTDFNNLFWNASSASYADWIDVQGRARQYFYVDIPFTAIIAGVANSTQAAALLAHYDARLADIYVEVRMARGGGAGWERGAGR